MAGGGEVLSVLVVAALAVAVSGCMDKSGAPKNSQIVAVVNDHEVTGSDIDQSSAPDGRAIASDKNRRAVDDLVGEELLVQGAIKRRLDRDPAVLQEVENARRHILARYFAERELYPKVAIKPGDIEEFYHANPILFQNRKRFQLKNFSIATAALDDELRTELDRSHSAAQLRDALEKHDIKYSSQVSMITADQLPVDKLGEFAKAEAGDIMIAGQGNGRTLLMFVVAIEDDNPMSFEHAKPYIAQYLAQRRNGQAVTDYLNQAKAGAKIDYPIRSGDSNPKSAIPLSVRESSAAVGGGFQ